MRVTRLKIKDQKRINRCPCVAFKYVGLVNSLVVQHFNWHFSVFLMKCLEFKSPNPT